MTGKKRWNYPVHVRKMLACAAENGHDFTGWSNEDIADDMIECGAFDDDDDVDRGAVIAAISAQRKA